MHAIHVYNCMPYLFVQVDSAYIWGERQYAERILASIVAEWLPASMLAFTRVRARAERIRNDSALPRCAYRHADFSRAPHHVHGPQARAVIDTARAEELGVACPPEYCISLCSDTRHEPA